MLRRVRDIATLLVLLSIALICGETRAQSPGVNDFLQRLTTEADRSTGTAGEQRTAEYIKSVFSSLPEQLKATTGEQWFATPVRNFIAATFAIGDKKISLTPIFANALATESTPPEGLTGKLVYGGRGELKEFDGKVIRDSIVLMDLDSGGNWQHAADLGARAVIYLDDGAPQPRLQFRDKEELTPVNFPRFWMGRATFQENFGPPPLAEGKTAILNSRTDWTKAMVRNLYCFIPGADPQLSGEILLVEAFYDASRWVPDHAPGSDEAASIATLLKFSAGYRDNPPRRSLLLLATTDHANSLAGLREAVWAISSRKKVLKAELAEMDNRLEANSSLLSLLNQNNLGSVDPQKDSLIHKALQDEIRNELESLNRSLQLARKDSQPAQPKIRELAQQKLLLRRLSWEPSYLHLSPDDHEQIQRLIPKALAHATQLENDLKDRKKALKSSLQLQQLVKEKNIVAAVSLFLSSHGSGVASVDNGGLYQLIPTINRTKIFSALRPVLQETEAGNTIDYQDLLGGSGRREWQNYFPDQPPMGGEVTALAGFPGFTLATINDIRPQWATPYDTLSKVDLDNLARQSTLVCSMLRALEQNNQISTRAKPDNGFATLSGRASFLRQGELFAEKAATDTLLQIYQDQHYSLNWVDSLGVFRVPGFADKKHSFGKAIIEGYHFAPGANSADWAIDKQTTGKDSYRVKINRLHAETDLVMFGATQTTLFDLRDARSLDYLTRLNVLDARTETEPLKYWFSRIDTRQSTMCSLFLEPDTSFKLTLSDSILDRKLLLLNSTGDNALGTGFPAATTPAVYNTSLRAAQDMMNLILPRVTNLENHSIINQRIRTLLDKGKSHLSQAVQAQASLHYDLARQQTDDSLALLARVYNDVMQTQQDVLAGVLFYIALFVPFAYCLERLLFAQVSIHKRIVTFFGILLVVIAIIYTVHPAFQLTYSPLVVVLAFFILGLSLLVAIILFARFEREMKNIQRRAHITSVRSISMWGAFVAAFSIGVTNLRRRKVRTALTCGTLIILTYTLLNFTSVKNSLDQGAVEFRPAAPYQGILLKAPAWRSLPDSFPTTLPAMLPAGDGSILRRVWWETSDKTRPAVIGLQTGNMRTIAQGLVGLDPGELQIASAPLSILQGTWLDDRSPYQLLLSDELAKRLNITTLPYPHPISLWGIPFTVQGIFASRNWDQRHDLDGEPLTPAIYPNEISSGLSAAEAEAAESGQEISQMASRYQHITGADTIIIPAATLLTLGGRLKSIAIDISSQTSADLSRTLANRYQLLVYEGRSQTTWLHYSASTLAYNGMTNVLIPSVIAILIVLNTMISSVVERKREIGVYTSVGLAPPHVASLFIAEAIAFAIISSVTGYLLAQTAAHLLAKTSLWTGMTANYSSLAGVGAMVMVMAVVLLSVIYPSRIASKIAIPDVNSSWDLPHPKDSTFEIILPFLIKLHEQEWVGRFLAEYYQAHMDISHGRFSTAELDMIYACPVGAKQDDHTDHPDCFNLSFRAWLAPFDFGIRQRVSIITCPSPDYQGFLEIRVSLLRQTGENNIWFRLSKQFLNDLRKQLLTYRSLSATEKERFAATEPQNVSLSGRQEVLAS